RRRRPSDLARRSRRGASGRRRLLGNALPRERARLRHGAVATGLRIGSGHHGASLLRRRDRNAHLHGGRTLRREADHALRDFPLLARLPLIATLQYMCCPPLIAMLAPVTNAASSDAR